MAPTFAPLDIAPPNRGRLVRALLTTYDAVDRKLLIDRVLPGLLGLGQLPDDGSADRPRAILELEQALDRVRHRVVVVSSTAIGPNIGWLRNYVTFRQVGARSPAVLHAKLWMFEWATGATRSLEVVVSSANLTQSGFTDQIQAGWRARVPLKPGHGNAGNRASWGDLPDFLEALRGACNDSDVIPHFHRLLPKAKCPSRARIIATLPDRPAGVSTAMKGPRVTRVRILSPFTGTWDAQEFDAWLERNHCTRSTSIELAVCPEGSPESKRWCLSPESVGFLKDKVRFGLLDGNVSRCVRNDIEPDRDRRWVHAKLYEFSTGKKSCLYIGSANFTPDAWAGRDRFELGVLLRGARLPWKALPTVASADVRTTAPPDGLRPEGVWGHTEWDGDRLLVLVRSARKPTVKVGASGPAVSVSRTKATGLWESRFPLRQPVPEFVTVRVPDTRPFRFTVLDCRPESHPDQVDELSGRDLQRMRDQLLFERYGAAFDSSLGMPAAAADVHPGAMPGPGGVPADYSVEALVQAREWFSHVDQWLARVNKSSDDPRDELIKDGRRLLSAFLRIEKGDDRSPAVRRAARVVADELRHHVAGSDSARRSHG